MSADGPLTPVEAAGEFEQRVGELRERIRKTLTFVEGISAAEYAGAGERVVYGSERQSCHAASRCWPGGSDARGSGNLVAHA